MKYEISLKNRGSSFAVPTSVVNKYIKKASEGYLKVLLYILSEGEGSFVTDDIAEKTDVDENIIFDAISFWISKNVISCADISPIISNEKPATKTKAQEKTVSKIEPIDPSRESLSRKITVKYSPKDLEKLVDESDELKFLMDNSQVILKRPIKYSEQGSLINLYEYYGFSVAAILMLLEYCEKVGKTSIGYIEAVAKNWFENNIIDFECVEKEIIRLLERNKLEKKVFSVFGLDTKPTPNQTAYIEKWEALGFDIDMISFAYEKCVDQTNKLSFQYINKILESWAAKGYKNREMASLDKPSEKKQYKKQQDQKKEHSYDLDEFYRMALNSTPNFKGE